MNQEPEVKLNEFSKEEMWDLGRKVCPSLTREAFEADWEEFLEMKKQRVLQ